MKAPDVRKTASPPATIVPGTDASVGLDEMLVHIAAELAAGLSSAADIRERYGISDAQWTTLKTSPLFRHLLGEAVRQFRGDLNAGARIQLKADIVLEDAIPVYDKLIHSNEIPAQARIDAGKFLAQIAGRNKQETATAGSGFTLNINLGEGREKLVINGHATPMLEED